MLELLPIVGIFVIFYLLMIRPAQRRAKETARLQRELEVGDPVLTNAGIFGTIRGLQDDRLLVEIADGVVITLARQAVVGVPPAEEAPAAYADEDGGVVEEDVEVDEVEVDSTDNGDSTDGARPEER